MTYTIEASLVAHNNKIEYRNKIYLIILLTTDVVQDFLHHLKLTNFIHCLIAFENLKYALPSQHFDLIIQ